jgi:hypothetical protein
MVVGVVPFTSSVRSINGENARNRVALRRNDRHHRIHGYRDRADSAG